MYCPFLKKSLLFYLFKLRILQIFFLTSKRLLKGGDLTVLVFNKKFFSCYTKQNILIT